MYFRGSNDILVILSVSIQWEDLWNSNLKKSFEIHGFGPLKFWMDLTQIQIIMILSYPNKKFRFGLSNEPKSTPSKQTTNELLVKMFCFFLFFCFFVFVLFFFFVFLFFLTQSTSTREHTESNNAGAVAGVGVGLGLSCSTTTTTTKLS